MIVMPDPLNKKQIETYNKALIKFNTNSDKLNNLHKLKGMMILEQYQLVMDISIAEVTKLTEISYSLPWSYERNDIDILISKFEDLKSKFNKEYLQIKKNRGQSWSSFVLSIPSSPPRILDDRRR